MGTLDMMDDQVYRLQQLFFEMSHILSMKASEHLSKAVHGSKNVDTNKENKFKLPNFFLFGKTESGPKLGSLNLFSLLVSTFLLPCTALLKCSLAFILKIWLISKNNCCSLSHVLCVD